MEKGLLFYFVIDFSYNENKFTRISEVKCSHTCTTNHKIEYEVVWPDGGISLLDSEFNFIFQTGQSKPSKCIQCIHVYDSHNTSTKKGIALYGIMEGKYHFDNYFSIIKTNGVFLQIPMNCYAMKDAPLISLPISYGILYNERFLFIEDRNGVYVFDIYRGYICYLKDKSLSNLNQEDMARIWFESHPMAY